MAVGVSTSVLAASLDGCWGLFAPQSFEIPVGNGVLQTELFWLLQEMNGGWSLATLLVMQIGNYAEELFESCFIFA